MSLITVGVPVYNGEDLLDGCLASLANQTFADFEVLIYDNASTDRTAEIARAWVERDARFKLFVQQENRGAAQNFFDVLDAATSPYFIWRAHDDLSDPDFLEEAYDVIRKRPETKLVVGQVRQITPDGSRTRNWPVVDVNSGPEPLRLARALLQSRASWFYGLWHRETLQHEFKAIWALYPEGWASDHLTFFRVLVRNEVSGSNRTTFVQRLKSTSATRKARPENAPGAGEMARLRRSFTAACWTLLKDVNLTAVQKATLLVLVPVYAGKRVYPLRKLVKKYIRERLGLRRA